MKAGDKFIEIQLFGTYHNADVIIHTVKQMSKDGLKMKAENDEVFPISSVILSYEQIKSAFESSWGRHGILFWKKTSSAGWVKDIQEDDFDDITHVEATNVSGRVSFRGSKLKDNDESMDGGFKYFSSVEKFAEYLSNLAGFEVPHKISDWLERHGYLDQEAEFRKSYSGNDLLYAADNGIHPQDFEQWQAWKRVLKGRFLPYEDAMALENTLEEKTDGLTIYDYE